MSSALPWYILLVPLIAAAVIVVATRPLATLSSYISVAAVLIAFACSCVLFVSPATHAVELTWIDFRPILFVPIGFTLDQLSKTMLVLVATIGVIVLSKRELR